MSASPSVLPRFLCLLAIALVAASTWMDSAQAKPSVVTRYPRIVRPSVDVSMVRPIPIEYTQRPTAADYKTEAILQDPRFMNCMGETGGPEDPNFVAVFAKCYSFAGRPRFGKRGWRTSMGRSLGRNPAIDDDMSNY